MSPLFSRPMVCLQYRRCISPIRLPLKPHHYPPIAPYSTSRLPQSPPPKPGRRGLKISGAVTFISILAGIYYESSTDSPSSISLNPVTFTPYTLTSKIPITGGPSETTIFTLSPPSVLSAPKLPLSAGILSIQIKQPQLQIARSYTPLPVDGGDDLRLLVKREPGGEMSRYLYSLKEGDLVEIRGPEVEYIYPPQDNKKIVFFAGGTGIAPALQMAGSLLLHEDGGGKEVEVLWAVRRKEETWGAMEEEVAKLVKRISTVGQGRKLVVRTYVDSERGIQIQDVETAISVKDGKQGSTRVFVSGPEGFIAWIAGSKDFRGGREEQGALGGMLKTVMQKRGGNIEVFKL